MSKHLATVKYITWISCVGRCSDHYLLWQRTFRFHKTPGNYWASEWL